MVFVLPALRKQGGFFITDIFERSNFLLNKILAAYQNTLTNAKKKYTFVFGYIDRSIYAYEILSSPVLKQQAFLSFSLLQQDYYCNLFYTYIFKIRISHVYSSYFS